MSTKKKLRQQRREKRSAERRKGVNPATVFILVTAVLIVILGVAVSLRGGSDAEAPWPGAVWSEAHGHWH